MSTHDQDEALQRDALEKASLSWGGLSGCTRMSGPAPLLQPLPCRAEVNVDLRASEAEWNRSAMFEEWLSRMMDGLSTLSDELRPVLADPAHEMDIVQLADAVAPRPIPRELVIWLRFADGVRSDGPSWWSDHFGGRLQSAAEMRANYKARQDFDGWELRSDAWLEIARDSHHSVTIELIDSRPAMLICPDDPERPVPWAPALSHAFGAVLGIIGLELVGDPDRLLAWRLPTAQRQHAARLEFVARNYERSWRRAAFANQKEPRSVAHVPPRPWKGRDEWPDEWN